MQLRLETPEALREDILQGGLELRSSRGYTLTAMATVYGPLASAPGTHVYRRVPLELPILDD